MRANAEPAPTFSVSELAATVRLALEQAFPGEVWIRGEIADLRRAKSGHVYFSLIEPNELGRGALASLPVTLLADRKYVVNRILTRAGGKVRMTDGVEVRLRARVDFYAPQGKLSLLMQLIDPEYTLGRLVADRDRLLRVLSAEGLLERQASLRVSPAPLRVGLVTSKGSAAEQDVLHELERSGYGFEVRTFHAQVQGAPAAETLVRALRSAQRHGCDVIALVRGGGARTDLAAFDSELVARAIAELDVAVWTGIGHEIDHAVADDVAHTAFKTPTACAAGIVERVDAFLGVVEQRWATIAGRATVRLDQADHELQRRRAQLSRDGHRALRAAGHVLEHRRARLGREAGHVLQHAETRLEVATARAHAVEPDRVLRRGFTLTRRASDGALVRQASDVVAGETLVTRTASGSVRSTVVADDS